MRAYTFNHFMFNGLCKGIQSNHATHAIRHTAGAAGAAYHDWDMNHKTLIYLDGGNSATMHATVATFRELKVNSAPDSVFGFKHPMPWATFNEDEATLEGILTAIAIVVHPRYYVGSAAMREYHDFLDVTDAKRVQMCLDTAKYSQEKGVTAETFALYTGSEFTFMSFLKGFRLAST